MNQTLSQDSMSLTYVENPSPLESNCYKEPTSAPSFSIGLTTYNRPELLKQTLASISAQTCPNFEVIVGNDYVQEPLSTELLGIRDPRIRIVNHPQNLGEIGNMNAVLGLSRGRYFTWQTDDDLYAPNYLEEVHSALIKFDYPTCVYTSFEYFRETSVPKVVQTPAGQGHLLSGRQFLRNYWSGKLKIMGCTTGVYDQAYLKRIGGVEPLADTPFALFSEHLLLIRSGLLEQVVYIDQPLVKFRIHENSWGSTTRDLALIQRAGSNLVGESVKLFSRPELRTDFRHNVAEIIKFCLRDFFWKLKARDSSLNRLEAVPYLLSFKKQLNSLKGSPLYWTALSTLGWVGVKSIAPLGLVRLSRTLRSFF